ncbi:MAG: thioredoxin family protein [Planctomycetes bacterium]|nr:thioredoxin family protein [Planctomycetota bacterium]
MNRRVALLCLLAALAAMSIADCIAAEDASGWQEDANQAWRYAQATQRPLVLYITMENCVYCRKMERESWSNRAVAEDIRRGFVAANVHAETSADLVVKLKVRAYPTTVIISPANGVVDRITGYLPPRELQVRLAAAARRSSLPKSPPR